MPLTFQKLPDEAAVIKSNLTHFANFHEYFEQLQGKELSFNDNKPIFITPKDYVKLKKLSNKNIWIINHKIYPNNKFKSELNNKLKEIDIR